MLFYKPQDSIATSEHVIHDNWPRIVSLENRREKLQQVEVTIEGMGDVSVKDMQTCAICKDTLIKIRRFCTPILAGSIKLCRRLPY